MEKLSIDCIAQHLKVFHEQAVLDKTADFGEPCSTCPHVMKECRLDWLTRMRPLFDRTDIQIRLDYPELPEDSNDRTYPKEELMNQEERKAFRQAVMETMEAILNSDLFTDAAQRSKEDYHFLVSHNTITMADSIVERYERILNEIRD